MQEDAEFMAWWAQEKADAARMKCVNTLARACLVRHAQRVAVSL